MLAFIDLGLGDLFSREQLMVLLRVVIVVVVGWLVARLAAATIVRAVRRRTTQHSAMIVRRVVFYSLLVLVLLICLDQLGLQISVLLGAAGILTVAIGFASQTSASNLVSGLFLLAERPFLVGNVIRVDDVTGEVLSIDLLSVKLRAFDNLYVRVPNETIIKSRVTNLSHFPIRRFDMKLSVAYQEDLEKVRTILTDIAERNPLCLVEPAPVFIFLGFGDSGLEMQFSVWAKREALLEMRNSMYFEVKQAFDAMDIEIPFPHRSLHASSGTAPIPVRVVEQGDRSPSS